MSEQVRQLACTDQDPVRVDVCVCTYRRPDSLGRLLRSISDLDTRSPRRIDVRCIIVDNDVEGPELSTAVRSDLDILWLQEPTRGIPFARNAALRQLRPDADYAAFVDDDEIVSTRWLQQHLLTLTQHDFDATTGPVRPIFEEPTRAWIIANSRYYRREYEEGDQLAAARTSNALVRASWFREPPALRFDESVGLGGGSDTVLFAELVRMGGRIGWSAGAVAWEVFPLARQTARWVFGRHRRLGYEHATTVLKASDSRRARARVAYGGAKSLLRHVVDGAGQVLKGDEWRESLLRSGRGIGMIQASLGLDSKYYG